MTTARPSATPVRVTPAMEARCRELVQRDQLTAERVVAEAADPDSPFHEELWKTASDQMIYEWRLQRARVIIRSFKEIRVVGGTCTVKPPPLFAFNEKTGTYQTTVKTYQEARAEKIVLAQRELRRWIRNHQRLGCDTLRQMIAEEFPAE